MRFSTPLQKFRSNKRGNIHTVLALAMLPLLGAVGAALDYSNVSRLRSAAQASADSAILAAAVTVRDEGLMSGSLAQKKRNKKAINKRLKAVFRNFFDSNMEDSSRFSADKIKVKYDPATGISSVKVENIYKPYLIGILTGNNKIDVGIEAGVVVKNQKAAAASIFAVLDRSSSMALVDPIDNVQKMTALQRAVGAMGLNISKVDPDENRIRTGGNAYSTYRTNTTAVRWGTGVVSFAASLTPDGGTESASAMGYAVNYMIGPDEENEHAKKHNQPVKKYIILMTDGANNDYASDPKTLDHCRTAKYHGITVYGIAFAAPSRGRYLVKSCATSNDHFFDAQNSSQLTSAFENIGVEVTTGAALTN